MRKKISSSLFTSSIKREIRHFLVVVVQWRQRNVQKSVMHVQSCCFANLNLLFFWSSRCRRRRRILRSLFSSRKRHRNALTEKAWKDVVQGPDNKEFKISLWRGVTTATWGENHFRRRHHPTCDAAFSLVCYTAVFSVGTLRDDTKNGCVADYFFAGRSLVFWQVKQEPDKASAYGC